MGGEHVSRRCSNASRSALRELPHTFLIEAGPSSGKSPIVRRTTLVRVQWNVQQRRNLCGRCYMVVGRAEQAASTPRVAVNLSQWNILLCLIGNVEVVNIFGAAEVASFDIFTVFYHAHRSFNTYILQQLHIRRVAATVRALSIVKFVGRLRKF